MAYGKGMHKTTLYLSDELRQTLEAAARRTGRAQADLVREALRTYLESLTPPVGRSIGAGDDADLSARDSEDWLRRQWSRP